MCRGSPVCRKGERERERERDTFLHTGSSYNCDGSRPNLNEQRSVQAQKLAGRKTTKGNTPSKFRDVPIPAPNNSKISHMGFNSQSVFYIIS